MKDSLVDEYMREAMIFILQSLFLGIGKLKCLCMAGVHIFREYRAFTVRKDKIKKGKNSLRKDDTKCVPIVRRVRWEHQKKMLLTQFVMTIFGYQLGYKWNEPQYRNGGTLVIQIFRQEDYTPSILMSRLEDMGFWSGSWSGKAHLYLGPTFCWKPI